MANRLPALPSLPSASRVKPQVKCQCGCGGLTTSMFCPGHDARHKGVILRVVHGIMTLAEVAKLLGKDVRVAVERDLKDKARLRRWKIELPKGFGKAEVEAEPVANEAVEQAS